MKQFKCPGCEKTTDHLLLNGYSIGDRLLEGVEFKITFDDAGRATAATLPKDASYMSGLNEKKWLKLLSVDAQDSDSLTCPNCGFDMDQTEDEVPPEKPRSDSLPA